MKAFNRIRNWLDRCVRLVAYDRIPGYRRLSWCERKRTDHAAIVMLMYAPAFWRAVFCGGVMTALMYVASWQMDLIGAPRDLLRALPLMAMFPVLVAARRKKIRALLCKRDTDHGHRSPDA